MLVLSNEETVLWCREHEIPLSDRELPERSDLSEKFKIPEDAQKRVYLVSETMAAFKVEPLFLVWFHNWDVWPSGQRMHVFERFRMSYGESRGVLKSLGHIFGKLLFFSHDEYGLTKGIDRDLL
jgi:hypothetical protein